MKCYCDTSFLASLYLRDANSVEVTAWAEKTSIPVPLTGLGELELTNIVQQRLFRREITREEAQAVLRHVESDLDSGFLKRVPLESNAYRKAVELAKQHTAEGGYRSLDVLHVAAALTLGTTEFFTYDEKQRRLALKAGLRVKPRG